MTRAAILLVIVTALFAGCASTPWEEDGRGAAPQPAEKKEYAGVVENVREATIDSNRSGVGSMAGAVIGGTAGASVGQGRGSTVGSVIGTVAGAVLGEAAAQSATQPGLEITVRLDDRRVIAVTQPTGETFKVGDRVRVVSDGRSARVTKTVTSDQ